MQGRVYNADISNVVNSGTIKLGSETLHQNKGCHGPQLLVSYGTWLEVQRRHKEPKAAR